MSAKTAKFVVVLVLSAAAPVEPSSAAVPENLARTALATASSEHKCRSAPGCCG